jgi:hypothetical protein
LVSQNLPGPLSWSLDDAAADAAADAAVVPVGEGMGGWQIENERNRGDALAFARGDPAVPLLIARITLQPQAVCLGQVEKMSGQAWMRAQFDKCLSIGTPKSRLQELMWILLGAKNSATVLI